MCGIAGTVSFEAPPEPVEPMLERMVHRGPDDHGVYADRHARLGFRRLAIVDLSPAGHQPMTNEDRSLWLVFNGEIYNYRELTSELRDRGHRFHSRTDSEVILHAYEEWGSDCPRRFNGMFAFALWDSRQEALFCARDRFGVKPFYYAEPGGAGGLAFASEIKALFGHPQLARPTANLPLIRDFLVSGWLDHTAGTNFAGIHQLPAAHAMTVSRDGKRIMRYWDLPPEQDAGPTGQRERRRAAEQFACLLEDSVRLRLHADVPVGTCLSGGLDSSSIVCLANRLLFTDDSNLAWHERGARQKTFSACYDDPRHDEREYIDQVIAATGAESNPTFPGHEDPIEEIVPRVVWHQDEPFGSTSILAQWHVMQAAHQRGMKVLLDGQGADELLAGYHGYFGIGLADQLLSGQVTPFVRDLALYRRYHASSWPGLARGMAAGVLSRQSRVSLALRGLSHRRKGAPTLLGDRMGGLGAPSDTWVPRPGSSLHATLYNHANYTGLPALLHYEDRNSMAFSIEARTPFLDYRLAEFVARVPNDVLLRHGLTKMILREAMAGVLPEPVRRRRDKKGFSTPEDTWFRTSLSSWVADILLSPSFARRGFVDPAFASALFEEHKSGRVNQSTLLWRLLSVELWARAFLDRVPSGT
ncbi:MAG TPA: asparagine synthase (glutamine-hydrolyzing) [Chloroflexota bacterium]|nr:asparagine synthase (glutamine-hydrolyzing) [Chloroflexota bacterium]